MATFFLRGTEAFLRNILGFEGEIGRTPDDSMNYWILKLMNILMLRTFE